jgi:hypothetical protein
MWKPGDVVFEARACQHVYHVLCVYRLWHAGLTDETQFGCGLCAARDVAATATLRRAA